MPFISECKQTKMVAKDGIEPSTRGFSACLHALELDGSVQANRAYSRSYAETRGSSRKRKEAQKRGCGPEIGPGDTDQSAAAIRARNLAKRERRSPTRTRLRLSAGSIYNPSSSISINDSVYQHVGSGLCASKHSLQSPAWMEFPSVLSAASSSETTRSSSTRDRSKKIEAPTGTSCRACSATRTSAHRTVASSPARTTKAAPSHPASSSSAISVARRARRRASSSLGMKDDCPSGQFACVQAVARVAINWAIDPEIDNCPMRKVRERGGRSRPISAQRTCGPRRSARVFFAGRLRVGFAEAEAAASSPVGTS